MHPVLPQSSAVPLRPRQLITPSLGLGSESSMRGEITYGQNCPGESLVARTQALGSSKAEIHLLLLFSDGFSFPWDSGNQGLV